MPLILTADPAQVCFESIPRTQTYVNGHPAFFTFIRPWKTVQLTVSPRIPVSHLSRNPADRDDVISHKPV